MSDLAIFLVGIGVFAITTTATLLYGYTWFTHKAIEDGIDVGEGWEGSTADEEQENEPDVGLRMTTITGQRFRSRLSLHHAP